jgi:hypothetical protein
VTGSCRGLPKNRVPSHHGESNELCGGSNHRSCAGVRACFTLAPLTLISTTSGALSPLDGDSVPAFIQGAASQAGFDRAMRMCAPRSRSGRQS